MTATRSTYIFSITAFLLGFGLGGLSLHVASAQGLFGLKTSISQIGSALVEMQKNVDDLQKNMGTIKHAKEQLAALAPESGGDAMKKEGESLKKMLPGMGQ
jgi:predicted  nucleic acid-binding Zn-ribbon protein